MKKFLFLLFAVCTFTANAQKVSSFHHNEGRIKEPVHNMFVKPMVADIQILPNPDAGKEREVVFVEGEGKKRTERVKKFPIKADDIFVYTFHMSKDEVEIAYKGEIQNIRSYAIYRVLTEYNAHCLVADLVNIDTENADKGYTITVMGFLGKYVNWRLPKQEDYDWMIIVDK